MTADLEQRLREALHDDAARARLVNPDRPADGASRGLSATRPSSRPRRRLLAAAAAVLVAATAAVWLFGDRGRTDVAMTPGTSTTTTTAVPDTTLDVEALEAAGAFRIDGVVVAIECTGTRTLEGSSEPRDVILGGQVTENPDGDAAIDNVGVAVGDRLALIVRDDGFGQRTTLYHPTMWYGEQAGEFDDSCDELVESVPVNLDGGFFALVGGGFDVELP